MSLTRKVCPADPGVTTGWQATLGLGVVITVVELGLATIAGHDGKPSVHYPIASFGAVACGLVGLLLPVVVFGCMDALCDSRAWGWLGKLRPLPVSSCEPERPGAFLLRPWNAHSSHAQIAAGLFVIARSSVADTRAPISCVFLGISLVVLGLVSYAWWGSRARMAWFVDNLMMEVHTVAVILLFLSLAFPDLELIWLIMGLAFTAIRTCLLREGAELLMPSCCSLLVALGVIKSLGGAGDIGRLGAALALSFCGFAPKLADINRSWMFGTTLFHYMEASAFCGFFLWVQTLPLRD